MSELIFNSLQAKVRQRKRERDKTIVYFRRPPAPGKRERESC